MSHGDWDWDEEVSSVILWVLVDDGGPNWTTLILFFMAMTLLAYHFWG